MKQINRCIAHALVVLTIPAFGFAQSENNARQAINESGQASRHASASAGHGIFASGQVTSAAFAMPLMVGGAVLGSAAVVSAGAGAMAMTAANAPIGQPLSVSDRVITTMPPNEALKKERGN